LDRSALWIQTVPWSGALDSNQERLAWLIPAQFLREETRDEGFKRLIICVASCGVGGYADVGCAQAPAAGRTAPAQVRAENEPVKKFSFVMFWKQNDANTQQVGETLRSAVTKRADRCEMSAVNVNDQANRSIVERYGVSRMPMPTVLCVAPNGAVTGAFVRKLNDEAVESALISPLAADIVKALQDKKIVVVHVKQAEESPLPFGAAEFAADPEFKARTTTVAFVASDPAEARLLKDIEINPAQLNGSMTVVMAPPGVLVGKFAALATKDQIATALHAAGKCCDDPHCKHNQQARPQ
jgi:hypothetical protein